MKIIKLFAKDYVEYFWLLIIIFISVILKLLLLGNQISNGIVLDNTLDFSWSTDCVERLLHGYIAGRDFIFTYGPLYQLIESLPSLILKQSSYISVLYAPILLIVFNCILLFILIKFITTDKKQQIILIIFLVFFIHLIAYDSNSLFRILLPFIHGILFLKYFSSKRIFYIRNIAIMLLPSIFGLYTFDLYVLCLVISIIIIMYQAIIIHKYNYDFYFVKKLFLVSIVMFIVSVIFEILVSFILGQNFK